MKLYAHQQRFIDKNPDRALLVWETGTGKTVAACEWIKKRKGRRALIVCPKSIVGKWGRDLHESGAIADIVTRDGVKRTDISEYEVIVIDEAQDFSSPLFSKARSARATQIYTHIKAHPTTHVLLLTATPVRSTPWNIHTLACYMQELWPVKEFRAEFEYMSDMFGHRHYELVADWRKRVRPYVEKIADIVLMKDCADIPEQKEIVEELPEPKFAPSEEYESPSAEWYARHQNEQGEGKLSRLKEILGGYRKAIVVCHYTAQIALYAKELGRDRAVFVLQGATKDPDEVIEEAKEADDCVFLIQASMGAGFDASEFSVVIFASKSFRYVDMVQMKGRVKRINNLHENLFIHLLAGRCDRAVHKQIMAGRDFDVHHEI